MADSKYVRFDKLDDGFDVIVLFPASVTHATVAEAFSNATVVSAGFVTIFAECYGKSTSLNIGSKAEDTALLRQQFPSYTDTL